MSKLLVLVSYALLQLQSANGVASQQQVALDASGSLSKKVTSGHQALMRKSQEKPQERKSQPKVEEEAVVKVEAVSRNANQMNASETTAAIWRDFASVIKPYVLFEGYLNQTSPQAYQYGIYATRTGVETICETGFQAGHSALVFLLSNPHAHVYSFDLANYGVTLPAVEFLQKRFPGRFTFVQGDSKETLGTFWRQNPGVRCDLSLVDGAHIMPWVSTDLKNFWHMASGPESMIIMSDTPCDTSWCHGPRTAWKDMTTAGIVNETSAVKVDKLSGYSVGFFLKAPHTDTLEAEPTPWHQMETAKNEWSPDANFQTQPAAVKLKVNMTKVKVHGPKPDKKRFAIHEATKAEPSHDTEPAWGHIGSSNRTGVRGNFSVHLREDGTLACIVVDGMLTNGTSGCGWEAGKNCTRAYTKMGNGDIALCEEIGNNCRAGQTGAPCPTSSDPNVNGYPTVGRVGTTTAPDMPTVR